MTTTPLCGVYRIVHLASGKCYVGSSINIHVRWRQHRRSLRLGSHHSFYLQRAWRKYGADAFAFEILELITDKNDLLITEQRHIDLLRPVYNRALSVFPGNPGHKHSAETRAKMSRSRRGVPLSTAARQAISEGAKRRYMRQEERDKTAAINRGKPLSPEHFAKLHAGHLRWANSDEGRAVLRANAIRQTSTPEGRHKVGNGNRGRKQSSEEIAKRSASLRAVMATPAYKANASAARKGKPKSDQHKAAIAAAQRKRLDNPELRARIAENTRRQHQRQREAKLCTANQDTLWPDL